MNRYLLLCLCTCMMLACNRPEDIECEAFVCVRNQGTEPNHILYYSWEPLEYGYGDEEDPESYPESMGPGECAVRTVPFRRTYDMWGDPEQVPEKINYYSSTGDLSILVDACVIEVNAPDSFLSTEEVCSNDRFDPDYGEMDIDCGGPCEACPQPFTRCNIDPYNLVWEDDHPLDPAQADSAFLYRPSSDSIRCIIWVGPYRKLDVQFETFGPPTASRRYDIGEHGTIVFSDVWTKWKARTDQHVYLEVDEAGNCMLNFCDIKFYTGNDIYASERTTADGRIPLTRR